MYPQELITSIARTFKVDKPPIYYQTKIRRASTNFYPTLPNLDTCECDTYCKQVLNRYNIYNGSNDDVIYRTFIWNWGRRGRDRMVVWIYNYLWNQCLSPCTDVVSSNIRSGRGVQHYVIQFVCDRSVVFSRSSDFRGNRRTGKKPTDLWQVTDKLYRIMLYTSPWAGFKLTTSVVIGTDCIGSYNSNYHTITTKTATST